MKIVEGKYYRDARGRKVGPMISVNAGLNRTFFKVSDMDERWTDAGLPMGLLDKYTEEGLRLVAEWDEIEWGDWQNWDHYIAKSLFPKNADYQMQRINGVKQVRFPKPKVEQVSGDAMIRGFHRSVEVTFVDGQPQWSTLKVAS